MRTLRFKTNLKCIQCIKKVKPLLDAQDGIHAWEVNLASAQKILTVNTDNLQAEDVITLIRQAGFKAEEKSDSLLSRIFS